MGSQDRAQEAEVRHISDFRAEESAGYPKSLYELERVISDPNDRERWRLFKAWRAKWVKEINAQGVVPWDYQAIPEALLEHQRCAMMRALADKIGEEFKPQVEEDPNGMVQRLRLFIFDGGQFS